MTPAHNRKHYFELGRRAGMIGEPMQSGLRGWRNAHWLSGYVEGKALRTTRGAS